MNKHLAIVAAFAASAALADAEKSPAEAVKDADVVWYVPGWMRTKVPHGSDWQAFTNAFPTSRHVFKGWDGNNLLWYKSFGNADEKGAALADEIAALPAEERGRLALVGHSMGARAIVRALARLGKKGVKVRAAVLAAAAIPNDDPDLDDMGLGSELPVVSLCNPDDITLKYIFALAGQSSVSAYGASGARKRLVNVVERAVPEDITEKTDLDSVWAKSDALKRVANHHAPFYFTYLKSVLNGEAADGERVLVPQDHLNWSLKVIDGEVWWDVLESRNGWKLERHKLTRYCRILDPGRRRAAWGDESKMRESFDKVAAASRPQ